MTYSGTVDEHPVSDTVMTKFVVMGKNARDAIKNAKKKIVRNGGAYDELAGEYAKYWRLYDIKKL